MALADAAPFLLATAKFPIDATVADEKMDILRHANPKHKARLLGSFAKGLHRDQKHNRVALLSSKSNVDKVLAHLQLQSTIDDGPWPSFMDWIQQGNEPAKVLAGHHRISALKDHFHGQQDRRYWICDIYDQGCQLRL